MFAIAGEGYNGRFYFAVQVMSGQKGVFFLAKEKKEKKQRSREFEQLKEGLKLRFVNTAHIMWGRELNELTMNEIYQTVAATAKQYISDNWIKTNKTYAERQEKQIYYFSIEFLMGRLLKSNLINLGIEEAVREVLDDFHLELSRTSSRCRRLISSMII